MILTGDVPSNLLNSYLYSPLPTVKFPWSPVIPNAFLLENLIPLPLSGPPVPPVPSPAAAPPSTKSMLGGISGMYAPGEMLKLSKSPGCPPPNSTPSPISEPITIPGMPPLFVNPAVKYGVPSGVIGVPLLIWSTIYLSKSFLLIGPSPSPMSCSAEPFCLQSPINLPVKNTRPPLPLPKFLYRGGCLLP